MTLVEVMIVIAILGILAALVMPRYLGAQETAEETTLRRQLQVVRGQVAVYRSENGGADPDMDDWRGLLNGDFIANAPRNPLNGATAVAPAGDFSGGWVWRPNTAGTMQVYATNVDHSGEFIE